MTARLLTAKLAAHSSTRAADNVVRCDAIGERLDTLAVQRWQQIITAFEQPYQTKYMLLHRLQGIIRAGLPQQLRQYLIGEITHLAQQSYHTTVQHLTQTLPVAYLQTAARLLMEKESGHCIRDRHDLAAHSQGLRAALAAQPYGHAIRRDVQEAYDPYQRGIPSGSAGIYGLIDLLFPPLPADRIAKFLDTLFPPGQWQGFWSTTGQYRTPDELIGTVAQGLSEGKTNQQVAKELRPYFDGSRVRAARAARTFGQYVANRVSFEAHERMGDLVTGYQVISAGGENARKDHLMRSGTVYYKNPEYGQVGIDVCPHPPVDNHGPYEDEVGIRWNCILPETRVGGRIKAALKAWYTGEIVEICTRRGCRISVTINHPIATVTGFVPAGMLEKGDDLFCHLSDVHSSSLMYEEQHPPASVEEVFGALGHLCSVGQEHRSSFNLYGDIKFLTDKIEIVRTDGILSEQLIAEILKRRPDLDFNRGDKSAAGAVLSSISSGGLFGFLLWCGRMISVLHPFDVSANYFGIVLAKAFPIEFAGMGLSIGTTDADVFESFSDSSASHAEYLCYLAIQGTFLEHFKHFVHRYVFGRSEFLGCGADMDPAFFESCSERRSRYSYLRGKTRQSFAGGVTGEDRVNLFCGDVASREYCPFGAGSEFDSHLLKPAGQDVSTDMQALSNLSDRFPRVIATDQVVEVIRRHYNGPVYDLETSTGYFTAGSMVVSSVSLLLSNCRCFLAPVLSVDPRILSAPEFAGPHPGIIEPSTHADWWATANHQQRRAAAGVRRYSRATEILSRTPHWEELIHPDGKLVKIKDLETETHTQRAERVMKVKKIMHANRLRLQQVARYGFEVPA